MTARLTDEQVAAWVALADPARSDHAIALACEVQEYRTRRCDGCAWWKPGTGECAEPTVYAGTGSCSIYTPADHACTAWTVRP